MCWVDYLFIDFSDGHWPATPGNNSIVTTTRGHTLQREGKREMYIYYISNVDVINQLNTNCIKTKTILINDQKRKEMKLCGYKLTLEMSNIFTYPQNIFVWIVALCCWGYLRKTQTDQYKISK